MPYCTQTDIEDQLPKPDLIALTDDEGFGEVSSVRLDRAINDAEAVIDAHCQSRYPLPLTPVPAIIRRICVDLAIYNLFSRRVDDDLPKVRESRKDDAMRFLKEITTGLLPLGAVTPAPSASSQAAIVSAPTRLFSRGGA